MCWLGCNFSIRTKNKGAFSKSNCLSYKWNTDLGDEAHSGVVSYIRKIYTHFQSPLFWNKLFTTPKIFEQNRNRQTYTTQSRWFILEDRFLLERVIQKWYQYMILMNGFCQNVTVDVMSNPIPRRNNKIKMRPVAGISTSSNYSHAKKFQI